MTICLQAATFIRSNAYTCWFVHKHCTTTSLVDFLPSRSSALYCIPF
jgi:hypothetical protein